MKQSEARVLVRGTIKPRDEIDLTEWLAAGVEKFALDWDSLGTTDAQRVYNLRFEFPYDRPMCMFRYWSLEDHLSQLCGKLVEPTRLESWKLDYFIEVPLIWKPAY